METNPTPRQRNRRAGRQPVEAQQPLPLQSNQAYQPARPSAGNPPQMQPAQQPVRPSAGGYPQMQPAQQPVIPSAGGYPQMQPAQQPVRPSAGGYPQMQPAQQLIRQPQASINQRAMHQAGWSPSAPAVPRAGGLRPDSQPVARAEGSERPKTSETPETRPARKKIPGWLSTATTACFLAVLALVAVYWLMQAYLTTEENKRIAAYHATLNNYHITERADGTLNVTWQDIIEQYAAQYNLQPAFVTAIIRTESSFQANAESSVGARGLMQLMPDTALWIAGKLGDSSYSFDRMYDPETNIRYGCWYLGYLSRLFHGDAELVSGAYHAGQSTITAWLSDPARSSDGVSLDLEKLPDGPTKQYIGRVTRSYGIYQSLLYPDAAFGPADAVSSDGGAAAAALR